jgi:hypothetical protein
MPIGQPRVRQKYVSERDSWYFRRRPKMLVDSYERHGANSVDNNYSS